MWIDIIGWIGGGCYAIFAIPQTLSVIKSGHAKTISLYFLILMWIGSFLSLIYIYPTKEGPLIINFSMSLITSSIMLKYKFFERKKI